MARPIKRQVRRAKGRQRPRARKPGMLDRWIAAIPMSEGALHKLATWSILGVIAAIAIGIASWFGVPGTVGVALAEGVGRAGFRVEKIEVVGLQRMQQMPVYQVALDQRSRAMPLVDLAHVRNRLTREFGWIADARVSRRLPDTLVIEVVERRPAAVWQHRGRLMLIDRDGVSLERVSADAMPNLPLVIGDGANGQEPAYRRLIDAAPALRPLVKAATWVGRRRWDLVFTTGERLALPEGEAAAQAALINFARMDGTDRLLGRGYRRFDMRVPGKLYVRLPDGGEREAITGEGRMPI